MKTWFTSDTHFGHANIIEYCKRPFKTLDRMNEVLIKNWNSRINPKDFVIFLGDFAFKDAMKVMDFLLQLNGNITFVKGNHDSHNSLNTRDRIIGDKHRRIFHVLCSRSSRLQQFLPYQFGGSCSPKLENQTNR